MGGFTSEANSWSLAGATCPTCIYLLPASTCNEASDGMAYGGPYLPITSPDYGIRYFQRTYSGTGGTTEIAIEFDAWVFAVSPIADTYDLKAIVWLTLDGNILGPNAVNPAAAVKICGSSISPVTDQGVTVNYYSKYRVQNFMSGSADLKLGIWWTLPIGTTPIRSVAMRNINTYPVTSVPHTGYPNFPCDTGYDWDGTTCSNCFVGCLTCSAPSNGNCNGCKSGYYDYQNGYCYTTCDGIYAPVGGTMNCAKRCSTGYYWGRDQSCVTTCNAPLLPSTDVNGFDVCNSPCTAATDFVYPDGSCDANCASPLTPNIIGATLKLCLNPCLNGGAGVSSQFLFPDGSCSGTCPSSLSEQTILNIKYCYSGCNANDFIYPDGSCSGSCDGPLTNNMQYTLKFCFSPCDPNDPSLDLYPDGTCKSSCPSPLSYKLERNIRYCYSTCGSQWIYPDGSCSGSCDSPLTTKTENSIGFCISPCDLNDPSLYLYPEGTCKNTCPSPLSNKIEKGIQYCYSSCASQYIYPDTSCSSNCDAPLTTKTEYTIPFCTSPCDPADPSLYLYPNSSCYSTCTSPLYNKTEYTILQCYSPCLQNNTDLYETGTCLEMCPSPNIKKTEPVGMLCQYPCVNTDYYYNTGTGKCTKTCEYPGEPVDSPLPKLCVSSLNEEEVKQVKEMAAMANSANSASSTGAMVWSIVSSSDSTAACMGPLAKMLQHIKWMDIDYPEKVLLMMEEQNKDALKGGFAKKMMGGALDKFPRHELPSKFELYQTPSSFFVNFWAALFNLSVILFVTLTVIFLKVMTKQYPKVNGVLRGVTDVLKWNLLLVTFSGNLGDVVLFTALEFLSMQFDNFEAILSFVMCLLINVAAIFVIVKILDVNAAIRKSMQRLSGNTFRAELQKKRIVQQWSSYKALFECYRDYSFYQQIFLFIFIIRMALFNAIIGYLYNYPLFQAIFFSLSNILMLLYLFLKRPMRKIVNLAQQIVLELVLLPFNTCVLTLAILDNQEMEKADLRKSIGTIIVYINIALPILSLVLMAVKFIAIAVELYQTWKLSKAKRVKRLVDGVKMARPQSEVIEEQQLETLPPSLETSPSPVLSDSTQIIDLNDQSLSTFGDNLTVRNQKRIISKRYFCS